MLRGSQQATPFSYRGLPRITRREAMLAGRLARLSPLVPTGAVEESLADLTGTRVEVATLPLERCPPGRLGSCFSDWVSAAILVPAEGPPDGLIALELDPRLAQWLVHRTLGGDRMPATAVAPLTTMERGVLSYVLGVVLTALERTQRTRFRLLTIITTPTALVEALGDEGAYSVPIEVTIDGHRLHARSWVPTRVLDRVFPSKARPLMGWLKRIPVTVTLQAGRASLRTSELASLRPGDIVLLDECRLTLARGEAGASESRDLSGSVLLALGGTGAAVGCATIDHDTVRLEALEPLAHPRSQKGQRMTNHDTDPLEESLSNAPVDIAVELARFTLPLGELSNLKPGEIVVTGRRLGERVTLRLSDRPVATGELVDVEGEIGVRILAVPRDS